jgi:hypothetical protein
VIVTDGKSWALDPQALARSGLRVTAVLIGEDALEAGIANLAGITGGQAFIATGSEAGTAIAAALEATRLVHERPPLINHDPVRIETFRRGARVVAAWGSKRKGKASIASRQIGATAAALAIPLMPDNAAARLAEAEGIVSHLTSLVLVDEAGEKQEGLPASRKIPLSAPRTAVLCRRDLPIDGPLFTQQASLGGSTPRGLLRRIAAVSLGVRPAAPGCGACVDLSQILSRIDWTTDPDALLRGDLSSLPLDAISAIRSAAEILEIIELADAAGVAPLIVVVALLARAASDRCAQRLARAVLGASSDPSIMAAMFKLGLEITPSTVEIE